MKNHPRLGASVVAAFLAAMTAPAALGQELTAVDNKSAKSAAAPRMANGRPDFSGYWKGTRDTVPGGNIAKDLPGLKLPRPFEQMMLRGNAERLFPRFKLT